MRTKAKRWAVWGIGLAILFGAGMFMGGSRAPVGAQTEVLVQGQYLFIDKSTDRDPRHYMMFDTKNGVLKEWIEEPDSIVYTYEFDKSKDIQLTTTTIRR